MFRAIVMTLPFPLRWEEAIEGIGADEGNDLNLSFIRISLALVLRRIGYGDKHGSRESTWKPIATAQAIDG